MSTLQEWTRLRSQLTTELQRLERVAISSPTDQFTVTESANRVRLSLAQAEMEICRIQLDSTVKTGSPLGKAMYSGEVDQIIFAEPFRSMPVNHRAELIAAIADQMGLPESIQQTVKAIVSDYQPE